MFKQSKCLMAVGMTIFLTACHRDTSPVDTSPVPGRAVVSGEALRARVKAGMSAEAVHRLLGRPSHIDSNVISITPDRNGRITCWEYYARDGILALDMQRGRVKEVDMVPLEP